MIAVSVADNKNRLTVRGVQTGARYLVKREGAGWWIEPAPERRSRKRAWAGPKRDLTEHLDALRAAGFSFEPEKKENVPPCRF